MIFPVTFESRIVRTLPGDSRWITDVLRTHIARHLTKAGAPKVTSEGNHISFQGRFWDLWVWSWNPLRSVTSGKITINHEGDRLSLTYFISFGGILRLVLLVLPFIAVTVGFFLSHAPIGTLIEIYGFGGCIVTADYLISVRRFRDFINRPVVEFMNLAAYADGRPGIKVA